MSITFTNNTYTPRKLWLPNELVEFDKWLQVTTPFKFKLQPTDPNFWMTKEEIVGTHGPRGLYGCSGLYGMHGPPGSYGCSDLSTHEDNRINYETNQMMICTEFKILEELIAQTLSLTELNLTKGGQDQTLGITVEKDSNLIPIKYGIYKKLGFDEAFTALRKMNPNLTEYQFIHDINIGYCEEYSSLCTEKLLYKGPEDLICEVNEYATIPSGYQKCTFSIMVSDVCSNFDTLKKILTRISHHIKIEK